MKIHRHLDVPNWSEAEAESAEAYWRRRGFSTFSLSEGPTLMGSRSSVLGSLWPYVMSLMGGNLLAVDWRKLRARLTMKPGEFGGVHVELDVLAVAIRGFSRRFTDWGPAFWRLEIAELEHVLRGEGGLEETWKRFNKAERGATSNWLWSKGLAGRRLGKEWEREISSLEDRFLLASHPEE